LRWWRAARRWNESDDPGAHEMIWAYVLSGALAAGLLVYLVVALIRAEDL
jgi:K+-transporting ATPase KdpF subunit